MRILPRPTGRYRKVQMIEAPRTRNPRPYHDRLAQRWSLTYEDAAYARRMLAIFFPLASSSTSLSR